MKRITIYILILSASLVSTSNALEGAPDITLLWNKFTDLRSVNGYVVGLSHDGLAVLEPSKTDNKLLDIEHLIMPSPASSMKLQGDLLVVRLVNDNLAFVDINQLPQLELLGLAEPPVSYADYELTGSYIYLSRWFDGIDKYKLHNFENLEFTANDKSAVLATQLDSDESFLFVLDRYNGLLRFPLAQKFGDSVEWLYVPERPFLFSRFESEFIISLNSVGFYLGKFDEGSGATMSPYYSIPSPIDVINCENYLVFVSPRRIDKLQGEDLVMPSIPIDKQHTSGDTINIFGQKHLLLPNIENGITAFNLVSPQPSFEMLKYPGPISAVATIDNYLIAGGNDISTTVYQIDHDSMTAIIVEEINNFSASDLLIDGDYLFVLIQKIAKVVSYDISDISGGIDIIDSVSLNLFDAQCIKSFYMPSAAMEMLMIVGKNAIEIVSTVNGLMQTESIWESGETIADAAISDNVLYITDRVGAITAYQINLDLSITKCGQRDLTGTGWKILPYGNSMLAFSGKAVTVFENCLEVDTILSLPLSVLNARFSTDTLFTIGANGLAKYNMASGLPEFIESGGLGGSKLSVGREFVTTTNGSSVDIYFRKSTSDFPGAALESASSIALDNNYPEPFNSSTVIQMQLSIAQHINLSIYNILGQQVRTLLDEILPGGNHSVRWDGKDNSGNIVASGIYFYKLESENESLARKMMLIR